MRKWFRLAWTGPVMMALVNRHRKPSHHQHQQRTTTNYYSTDNEQ